MLFAAITSSFQKYDHELMKDRKQLRALEKEALEEASANNDDDEGDLKKENTLAGNSHSSSSS